MNDRTLVNFTAVVEQVFATRQERESKKWDPFKKELVPQGYQDTGWLIRLKDPSLKSCFPLADMSVTMWRKKGETPDIHPGKKYTMEVSLKGPYRTLVSWREIHEEEEGDIIDQAAATLTGPLAGGGRKVTSCPPPPPPVQPDQSQLELMRRRLDERKAQRRQEGR